MVLVFGMDAMSVSAKLIWSPNRSKICHVIRRDLGLVDRFETDQKVLTAAPAGAAAPTGPATAPASPGSSRTELIRVFYVVFYPYRAESPLAAGCAARLRSRCDIAVRSDEARAMAGCGEAESGPTPSQRI